MFYFFLIIFFISFFILARARLDLALMLIIAALPSYLIRFKIFSIPFTLLEGMILIAFFCWVINSEAFKKIVLGRCGIANYFKENKKNLGYLFGVEISLLVLISWISASAAGFSEVALGAWKAYFLEPALLYILIINIFKGEVGWKKICLPLAIGALGVSALAIGQKITGLWIANPAWAEESARRAVSFFGYPNAVGLYLGPIIMILIGVFAASLVDKKSGEKPKKFSLFWPLAPKNITAIGLSKGFLMLIIIVSFLSIFYARSEGALAGLAAAIILFFLLSGWRQSLLTVFVLLFAGGIILGNPLIKNYVLEKITLRDFSGQVRRFQWRETINMIADKRFFTGAGLANYKKMIAPYHQEGFFYNKNNDPDFNQKVLADPQFRAKNWQPLEIYLYPHNIILNFWVELGFFGLLLFIWIMIKFLIFNFKFLIKEKNKKDKYIFLGLFGAMIATIIHGIVDVPYFKNDLACLFWILIALLSLLKLKKEPPAEGRRVVE